MLSGNNMCVASGGTETVSGGYKIHKFTTNGTLVVTTGCSNADVLVVAGGRQDLAGGAGGSGGGGSPSQPSWLGAKGGSGVVIIRYPLAS